MTTTPTPWNTLTQANTSDGGFSQLEASVVALPDGGYLVSWTNDTVLNAYDILGQRYDALGHKVGGEIDLDSTLSGVNSYSQLAELPGGGVAMAFVNDPGTKTVYVHRYAADIGAFTTDTIGVGDKPAIATFSDGGYVVSQNVSNGVDNDTYVHLVTAAGTVGAAIPINITPIYNSDRSHVAVLSSGDFVVTYEVYNGADTDVRFQVLDQTGTPVVVDTAVAGGADGANEAYSEVTALKGGGFVVAWQDSAGDSDSYGVRMTIYSNAGTVVAGDVAVNTTQTGDQLSPFLTALSDGGFIVSWQDDGGDATRGQRFDASGNPIGSEFTIQSGPDVNDFSHAVELRDGRVAYGLSNTNTGDYDVNTIIFDPRTSPINGTSKGETLTGRIDGSTVNGLGGDDTLYGFGGKDTLNGGKGDDTLKAGDKKDLLSGGKGDDKLFAGAGADTLIGGKGADKMHAGSGDDRDVFAFTSKHDSGNATKDTWDKLYDFDPHKAHEAVSDKIDLSAIDTDKQKGDQEFRFVDHFSTAQGKEPAGEVMVEDAGKNVKVLVDVDGDKNADMVFEVMHVSQLHQADFIL